jgi:lincosamide nucleotidyltransferase A/C/D/E
MYQWFVEGGVACWVMGGWGVDALLGRETRTHHDLDLLISVDDLGRLRRVLIERRFTRKLIWENESRWIDVDGSQHPTAFVEVDSQGRELDIHVVRLVPAAAPILLCDVPWQFTDVSLGAIGTLAGSTVACVSADTQIQMHSGYDLPEEQVQDVQLLRGLVGA